MNKVNQKKTRAKYECDPVLEEFIARANLCSFVFPFENYIYRRQIESDGKTETYKKIFNIVTTELSLETKEYLQTLFRNDLGIWETEELNPYSADILKQNERHFVFMFRHLGNLHKTKKMLNLMVEFAPLAEFVDESEGPNSELNKVSHLILQKVLSLKDQLNLDHETVDLLWDEFEKNLDEAREIVSATDLSISSSGNIHFNFSPFAAALQDVNISRIRKCEVCEKFFWAKQRNIYTCSKLHAKRRQMRLLRERWKENGEQYLGARNKRKEKNKK